MLIFIFICHDYSINIFLKVYWVNITVKSWVNFKVEFISFLSIKIYMFCSNQSFNFVKRWRNTFILQWMVKELSLIFPLITLIIKEDLARCQPMNYFYVKDWLSYLFSDLKVKFIGIDELQLKVLYLWTCKLSFFTKYLKSKLCVVWGVLSCDPLSWHTNTVDFDIYFFSPSTHRRGVKIQLVVSISENYIRVD